RDVVAGGLAEIVVVDRPERGEAEDRVVLVERDALLRHVAEPRVVHRHVGALSRALLDDRLVRRGGERRGDGHLVRELLGELVVVELRGGRGLRRGDADALEGLGGLARRHVERPERHEAKTPRPEMYWRGRERR